MEKSHTGLQEKGGGLGGNSEPCLLKQAWALPDIICSANLCKALVAGILHPVLVHSMEKCLCKGTRQPAWPPTRCTLLSRHRGHSVLARSPFSLRIYRGNDPSNKQDSLGTPPSPCSGQGHLWDVAQLVERPSPWEAEDLRQSILANKSFQMMVPGFPFDCSSSISSSNRPQPAVSISNKGIVVSSVEVTPGRSLHKVFGKAPINHTGITPKG